MAKAGANLVIAIELSNSVRTIAKKAVAQHKNRIFLIQADIAHLPIKKSLKLDLIYCINVIQHTQNETATLIELSRLMSKKSQMLFNIYLQRKRVLFISLISLLRQFTGKLPYTTLKVLLFLPAVVFWLFSKLKIFSIGHNFKETWLNLYDMFGGHDYQKFYTETEVSKMLKKAKLQTVKRSKYVFVLTQILPRQTDKNI